MSGVMWCEVPNNTLALYRFQQPLVQVGSWCCGEYGEQLFVEIEEDEATPVSINFTHDANCSQISVVAVTFPKNRDSVSNCCSMMNLFSLYVLVFKFLALLFALLFSVLYLYCCLFFVYCKTLHIDNCVYRENTTLLMPARNCDYYGRQCD